MERPGLRELKRARTRNQIAQTAMRLFAERGFDGVTVAAVAAGAEVSEATVFNYFGAKEELFFAGMEAFEVELVAAVRDRRKGQSVLDAFRDVLVERSRGFATRDDARGAALGARLISESASLRRRELEIVADHTKTLAEILAAETEATDRDVRPFVVANALMGVHRALVDLVRRLAVEGVSAAKIGSRVAEQAELGLAALHEGLGD